MAQPLDREDIAVYALRIEAFDQGWLVFLRFLCNAIMANPHRYAVALIARWTGFLYRRNDESIAAGNVGAQYVDVYLQDVNDNAPIGYTVPQPCIFWENEDPEKQRTCEIRAYDRDTRCPNRLPHTKLMLSMRFSENGPPFKFELEPGFRYENFFDVKFDQSKPGVCESSSMQRFQMVRTATAR